MGRGKITQATLCEEAVDRAKLANTGGSYNAGVSQGMHVNPGTLSAPDIVFCIRSGNHLRSQLLTGKGWAWNLGGQQSEEPCTVLSKLKSTV